MRRFPDALTFLFLCLAAATILTYVLPAGEYDRRDDPVTSRKVVVAGTYHRVAAAPVGPFEAIVAIPRGFSDASAIIAFVLLVGAGLTVVDKTGVLREGADWLIDRLHGRGTLIVPVICIAFAIGGLVEGLQEEVIALVPLMVIVTARLGYRPTIAVAISFGSAIIGGAFSPMNPFVVGIAQKLAGLPLLSGWPLRIALVIPAMTFWIWATLRAAHRPEHRQEIEADASSADGGAGTQARVRLAPRAIALLALLVVTVIVYLIGVMRLGWDFDQMAALFLALGVISGLAGGLGVAATAEALSEGLRGMVFSGAVIGFARAIYLVLAQAHVIDTIVYGLFAPVSHLPRVFAALGMMLGHSLLHVPVPSTSGQAVLSMPILVPLADLIRLPAQVAVLAYQFGAGLCDLITPTNGALMATLAAARVSYDEWIKFFAPLYVVLMAIAGIGIIIAVFAGQS
jgi:uncharacterized ion transporter superfamily protein YfcC